MMYRVHRLVFVVSLVLLVILAGCAKGGDVTGLVQSLPEVRELLAQYPNARITAVLWSAADVQKNIESIRQDCGVPFKVASYYKIDVLDEGVDATIWLNPETNEAVCVIKRGTRIQPTPPRPAPPRDDGIDSGAFCGSSTYGTCESSADCVVGGCSGQVCGSKFDEPRGTTCEYRACYDAASYGLGCGCVKNRCQWAKGRETPPTPTPPKERISADEAVGVVRDYFHQKWFKVMDGCGKYNERTGRMEPDSVSVTGQTNRGYVIALETWCGGPKPSPQTFEYVVEFNGNLLAEGRLQKSECGNGVCEPEEQNKAYCLEKMKCPEGRACAAVIPAGCETYCPQDCASDYGVAPESPIEAERRVVAEEVKCVFARSDAVQSCYSDDGQFGCNGRDACVMDVKGESGQKMTWKSSCGGYAYTILDGQVEYAEFECGIGTVGAEESV